MITADRKLYLAKCFALENEVKRIFAVYLTYILGSDVGIFIIDTEINNVFSSVKRAKHVLVIAVCYNASFVTDSNFGKSTIRALYMLQILKIINVVKLYVKYNGNIRVKIKKGIHILAGFKQKMLVTANAVCAPHRIKHRARKHCWVGIGIH